MTVKELIEYLQTLNPELRVVYPGYEGGYEDANVFEIRELCLNVHPEWYYGDHEDPKAYGIPEGTPTVPCLIIC